MIPHAATSHFETLAVFEHAYTHALLATSLVQCVHTWHPRGQDGDDGERTRGNTDGRAELPVQRHHQASRASVPAMPELAITELDFAFSIVHSFAAGSKQPTTRIARRGHVYVSIAPRGSDGTRKQS